MDYVGQGQGQATHALAMLYASSRLYINFFQPSFKLKEKTRDGARVSKKYHAPATPCDRLLESSAITESVKSSLREKFASLDPVRLLRDMRASQAMLAAIESAGSTGIAIPLPEPIALPEYLEGLATAWKAGEVRPTHRRKVPEARWWRTRSDPFELAWPVVEGWLVADPSIATRRFRFGARPLPCHLIAA